MDPVFNVRTMQVSGSQPRMPQEALDMFGAALVVAGNADSMRFETMESQFDPAVYSPNPVSMMLLHKVFPFLGDMKNATVNHKGGCLHGVEWTAVVLDCREQGKRCFFLEGFKPCRLFAMGIFAPMFVTSQMPQDRLSPLKVTHVVSGCCRFCGSVREKFQYCSPCKAKGHIAQYCNAECQLADWKSHKKTCFARKI
jgi:hypothetical protein